MEDLPPPPADVRTGPPSIAPPPPPPDDGPEDAPPQQTSPKRAFINLPPPPAPEPPPLSDHEEDEDVTFDDEDLGAESDDSDARRLSLALTDFTLIQASMLLQGYLIKSPPGVKTLTKSWRRRWFSLYTMPGEGAVLEYYTCKEAFEDGQKPKGRIPFGDISSVETVSPCSKPKFVVHTAGRSYHLIARSQDDMQLWVQMLNDQLDAVQDPDDIDWEPRGSASGSGVELVSHAAGDGAAAVLKTGFLRKSPSNTPLGSRPNSKWRKRFCVLFDLAPEAPVIEYYANESAYNGGDRPKGRIEIDRATWAAPVTAKQVSDLHMFSVNVTGRSYFLCSESEAEMSDWLKHIGALLAQFQAHSE
eukprot:m.18228 g.18228  ORF g.18228 m.18228 type:complete len:360 (+) comp5670_c0_seq1:95-1174(+)